MILAYWMVTRMISLLPRLSLCGMEKFADETEISKKEGFDHEKEVLA